VLPEGERVRSSSPSRPPAVAGNDRVRVGIERVAAIEDFDAGQVLFDVLGGAVECLLDDVSQETAQAGRGGDGLATKDGLELTAHRFSAGTLN